MSWSEALPTLCATQSHCLYVCMCMYVGGDGGHLMYDYLITAHDDIGGICSITVTRCVVPIMNGVTMVMCADRCRVTDADDDGALDCNVR
jgi:hypothetical protein